MNLAALLRERALASGDAPAIVDRSGAIGFDELDRAAACAAADLMAAGLQPGDRVLLLVPVSITLYAVLIGLFRIGATAVLLDPSAGKDHIERCCELARPRGFVGAPAAHVLRLVSPGIRAIPTKLTGGGRLPWVRAVSTHRLRGGPRVEPAPAGHDTPALLTFTSGSTGEPKGVVRSHGFLLAQHRAIADTLALRSGDVQLTALPVFVLSNLAAGVTSILPDANLRRPGEIDPAPVLFQIRTWRATSLVASPALLERLSLGARGGGDLAGLERIFTGGAPVFPRVLRALREAAPAAAITAIYGSTEAEPIARIGFDEMTEADFAAMREGAGLLAGHTVPATDVHIIPDTFGTPIAPLTPDGFAAKTLPSGSVGEIVVAGDHVLTAYLNGLGEGETKFHVGSQVWHRTGDAGYFDTRGRLWLLGRCRARVEDRAGTLYPFPVECAALELPEVRRAAFVSHQERRLLIVELEAGVAEEGVHARLLSMLKWSGVTGVHTLARMPMDRRHNAKIDYPRLLALLRQR